MFTFVSISYNHSEYIIQHLESIKYQILNFGYKRTFNYILCDDNSSDDTVEIAKIWLRKNKNIFHKTIITKNEYNLGTVSNYLNAISLIETNDCKILASDDLYGQRNIFNIYKGNNVILNFSYPFFINKVNKQIGFYNFSSDIFEKQRIFLYIRKKWFLKWFVANNKSLSGPSNYYPANVLKNRKLKNSLIDYKLIEDRPLWRFLFLKNNIDVKYNFEPLIYYRASVGVTSSNNKAHAIYKSDCDKLSKELKGFNALPKFLNPFNYFYRITSYILLLCFLIQHNMKKGLLYNFNKELEIEEISARKHIKLLDELASKFKLDI